MEARDGDLILGGEAATGLPGHGSTSARNCSMSERAVFPVRLKQDAVSVARTSLAPSWSVGNNAAQ